MGRTGRGEPTRSTSRGVRRDQDGCQSAGGHVLPPLCVGIEVAGAGVDGLAEQAVDEGAVESRGHGNRVAAADGAVRLTGLDDGDGVTHDTRERERAGPLAATGPVEELVGDHHQRGRPLSGQRQQRVDQTAELLHRVVTGGQGGRVASVEVLGDGVQDAAVDGGLGWEVVDQPGVAEAGGCRDARQARAGVALGGEQPLCLDEDACRAVDGRPPAQSSMTLFGSGLRSLGPWL